VRELACWKTNDGAIKRRIEIEKLLRFIKFVSSYLHTARTTELSLAEVMIL